MSDNRNHAEPEYPTIYPTGPGSNPSSYPGVAVPIDPAVELPRSDDDADFVDLTDGSRIAVNGAVIEEPDSSIPEVLPPHEYTPEKEDLNLLIM